MLLEEILQLIQFILMKDGNLFDPNGGKKDLENGYINFIGDADKRIKEDYLRILRYLRFFLSYSKQPHETRSY